MELMNRALRWFAGRVPGGLLVLLKVKVFRFQSSPVRQVVTLKIRPCNQCLMLRRRRFSSEQTQAATTRVYLQPAEVWQALPVPPLRFASAPWCTGPSVDTVLRHECRGQHCWDLRQHDRQPLVHTKYAACSNGCAMCPRT